MAIYSGKNFGNVPLFDPAQGMLIREPLGVGAGWWAGAPSAAFDVESNEFYLVYRQRQPRDLGRGVECRIAASDNGVTFDDIWALPKASLGALSLERACLLRGPDGVWRLYIGYVHPDDRKWRIGLLEADAPDRFDPAQIQPLLTADMVGGEGVKDPNVFQIGPMIYLLASYATSEPVQNILPDEKHMGGDIFSTGLTRSRTGAALGGDGRHFQWLGDVSPLVGSGGEEEKRRRGEKETGDSNAASAIVFENGEGYPAGGASSPLLPVSSFPLLPSSRWDAYCRRIGTLLPLDSGGYLAFYDGGASVAENYEEKTGLAITFDLRTYHSLSLQGPALVSPYGSGSLRYVDALSVGRELFYYYEMAREDGGHELRVAIVERD